MELFKGYAPTKNKVPLIKIKDAELMTLEEVQQYPEYCGVLDDNTVLIDFDDEHQSDICMRIVEDLGLDCDVYKTTRGRHFYFRNDGVFKKCQNKLRLACGLYADIKIGGKTAIGILKKDGVERHLEWDAREEGRDYQTVPNFLYPLTKKCDVELLGLGDGDGRNSELFRYIPTLQALGFSNEEVKEVGKIINEYVFDKPLSESEFNTVFRDEAFVEIAETNNFQDKNGFRHDLFGDYIISESNIVRINGQLHIYKDGIYVNAQRDIELAMIKKLPKLKAAQRVEVMKYIELKAEVKEMSDAKYIAFKNGIYNLATGLLEEFSPSIVVTNQIPWDYVGDAHSELAEKTLMKIACGKREIVSLLEECIGYCFYRRNQLGKAFFLTGDKSNGKSTFLDMLSNLLGEENISALDISELEERFSVAGISGKLANIGDDISDEFLQGRAVATFKKMVTGDRIKAELKGENPFMFKPYVKLLFSANTIPRTKDRTGAVLRRMVIIPFNATFSKSDPDYDPYIKYKLEARDVMEHLARVGIEGLKRVLENYGFTESSEVMDAISEYELDNNPVLAFFEETSEEDIENQLTNEVYSRYKVFCVENSATPLSKSSFSKEVRRRYSMVSRVRKIDGKCIRLYTKEE